MPVQVQDVQEEVKIVTHSFKDYLEKKRRELGSKFDKSDLAPEFIPYYENGKRIRVKFYGMEKTITGTVGITTGWKPVFLLMRTARSISSPHILSRKDHVVGVVRKKA